MFLSKRLANGQPDPDDFLRGFHHALEVGTAIVIVGAVIAALTLHKPHHPETAPEASFAEAEAA